MPSAQKSIDSLLEKLFNMAAWRPLLFLGVVLAIQTVFTLDARSLWYSDEVRHANVFQQMIQGGHWLVLHMNGEPYPDKPPVYFWFLGLLRLVLGHDRPPLFFLGAAVSAFIYLSAVVFLGRKVLQADKPTLFGAGGILLTTFYFVGVAHYSRMDLFFASLILFSQTAFFLALQRDNRTSWTSAGFVLMAAAALTKGPLGLVLPALSLILYALWSRRLSRLWRRDMGVGLLLCVLVLAAWFVGAFFIDHSGYMEDILQQQIYKRAVETWHHGQPFWHYFATLPLALLPWSLIVVAAGLPALHKRAFWKGVAKWRSDPATHGAAYLWIMALGGLALLSAVSIKIVIYLLPLFAPFALLLSRSLLGLVEERSRRLRLYIAGFLGAMAMAMPVGSLFSPWPIEIRGVWLNAALLALLALGLWKLLDGRSPRAVLMYLLIGITVWIQPVGLITAPSLDAAMSPKAQAEAMGRYIEQGYAPAAHKVYDGIFAYYAGHGYADTHEWPELVEFLETNPKAVVAMPVKHWDAWEDRQGLEEAQRQWIVDRPYVLAARPLLSSGGGE